MNLGRARAIFNDIENAPESMEKKGLAIRTIINMETHNSVTKAQMLKVIEWMWNQIYEMEQEDE